MVVDPSHPALGSALLQVESATHPSDDPPSPGALKQWIPPPTGSPIPSGFMNSDFSQQMASPPSSSWMMARGPTTILQKFRLRAPQKRFNPSRI